MNRKYRAVASSEGHPLRAPIEDLVGALRSFAGALNQREIPERAKELLPSVLQHAFNLGLKQVNIADAVQVTEPTVSRWAAGDVSPHILVAQGTLKVVHDLAMEKAAAYDQIAKAKVN